MAEDANYYNWRAWVHQSNFVGSHPRSCPTTGPSRPGLHSLDCPNHHRHHLGYWTPTGFGCPTRLVRILK